MTAEEMAERKRRITERQAEIRRRVNEIHAERVNGVVRGL